MAATGSTERPPELGREVSSFQLETRTRPLLVPEDKPRPC